MGGPVVCGHLKSLPHTSELQKCSFTFFFLSVFSLFDSPLPLSPWFADNGIPGPQQEKNIQVPPRLLVKVRVTWWSFSGW